MRWLDKGRKEVDQNTDVREVIQAWADEPQGCTHNNISDCSAAGCPGVEQ